MALGDGAEIGCGVALGNQVRSLGQASPVPAACQTWARDWDLWIGVAPPAVSIIRPVCGFDNYAEETLRSYPADGVVLDVFANPGEFMSLAVPASLLNLVPDASLQIRAEVDARDIARLCEGQAATGTAEAAPGATLRARVESISPMISARTIFAPGADTRSPDVARILLALDDRPTNLPIGALVALTFAPCAAKTPAN